MRLSTDRRPAALLLALALALAGCDSGPRGTAKGGGTATGPAGPSGGGPAGVAVVGPSPRQAADALLKAVTAGKAAPAQLTAAFKAQTGRSDEAAAGWLADQKGKTFVVSEEAKVGNALVLRGRADAPDAKQAFALRVVKDGDAYKADWLHFTERMGTGIQTPADPDLAAAQDAVRNFLDLLLGERRPPSPAEPQAHALMTAALKKSVSPLPPGAKGKDGKEYDPGFLAQATRAWASGVVGYSFAKADLGPNKDTATFAVELEAGGQKTPATVQAVKDKATGWWLVDSFSK